jgi:hypothetical protein
MPLPRDPYDEALNPKGTDYVARLIRDVDGGRLEREFAKEAAARRRERRKEATKRRNLLKREAEKQRSADRRAKRRSRCKKRETYRRAVVWHERRAGVRGVPYWRITLSCGHVEVRQVRHWEPRIEGRPLRCRSCASGVASAAAEPTQTEDHRETAKAAM